MYPFKMRGTNKLTILFLCLAVWGLRLWKASLSFSHIIPHWHHVCFAQQIEPRTRHNCWALSSQNHPKSYLWTCMYTVGSWQGSRLVTAGHVDLCRLLSIWIFALALEWNPIIPALNSKPCKIVRRLYIPVSICCFWASVMKLHFSERLESVVKPCSYSHEEDRPSRIEMSPLLLSIALVLAPRIGWGVGKPAELRLVFICLCVAIWLVLTETQWHLSKAKHSNLSRAMCNERQRGFVHSGKACHMSERPEKSHFNGKLLKRCKAICLYLSNKKRYKWQYMQSQLRDKDWKEFFFYFFLFILTVIRNRISQP